MPQRARNEAVVDLSQQHGLGPAPIPDRDSHTADLAAFDAFLSELKGTQRVATDTPYSAEFWEFVRAQLAQCTDPVGYNDLNDGASTLPMGPEDVDRMIGRVVALGLFIPMHPVRLAEAAKLPVATVLTELLYATKIGLATMRWAPECVRCGSAVTISTYLQDLPGQAHCSGCHQENFIESLDTIMVTFTFSPRVLYILANNYPCALSAESAQANRCFAPMPATNSGSGFRYSLGAESNAVAPQLRAGTYRMHCPVSMTDNLLTVERDATPEDEALVLPYKVSDFVVTGSVTSLRNLTVPHGRIHFDVYPDTRSFFVLWIQENLSDETLLRLPEAERGPYTPANEVINHPAFHLFEDQVVPSNAQSLSLRDSILVFTDIVGSTDLYAELGDGQALLLVHEHFQQVFKAFAARGRVVKTIGDAVMASFNSGSDALYAVTDAIEGVQRHCRDPRTGLGLKMRVGVNRGPALVVPVNGVNDFFGQTVNVAARLQSSAQASECLISEEVFTDAAALAAYHELAEREHISGGEPTTLKLKGVQRPLRVRSLACSAE